MSKRTQNFKGTCQNEPVIDSEVFFHSKMHIFHCSCGEDILIVPTVKAMNTALRNHITRHPGQFLTEQVLVEAMLKLIADGVSDILSLTE